MIRHLLSSSSSSFAVQTALLLLLLTAKCGDTKPVVIPPPDIGADAVQSLNLVIMQSEASQDFVARFKGKLDSFGTGQINLAKGKYSQTLTEVNSTVDELKRVIAGTSTLSEDEFKNKAKSAVDTNVVLNSLMENAVFGTLGQSNFVLHNANTLPDAWTKIWRVAPTLSPQLKQQFVSFLDNRIRYKTWDAIKKR